MISIFLREQQRYTQKELISKFQRTEIQTIADLRRLKEFGVLKTVKKTEDQKHLSDLVEEEIEIADFQSGEEDHLFVFTFVGIITVHGLILKCYPKYLIETQCPLPELKQVLKVLDKFNNKEQIIKLHNESNSESTINLLPIMLYLMSDYHENGPYLNTLDTIEVNGTGEILWEKTINETFVLISNNRPIYPELYTRKRENDDISYFKRLHECIVSKCSKELQKAGLLELFDLLDLDISDEEIDDFGEKDYILEQIHKELNVQFVTRKQALLKTMFSYICSDGSLDSLDTFSLYATNSFHVIWEKVCADVLNNQLQTSLGNLELPISLVEGYIPTNPLISLIDKPLWQGKKADGNSFEKEAKDTLIPDTITIEKNGSDYQFVIFDAKYYNLQLENNLPLRGQPGIESVTKQYLYQLAFQKFTDDHKIKSIKNCFLLPTEEDSVVSKGIVTLKMFKILTSKPLADIDIRLIPAKLVYSTYLNNGHLKVSDLKL